MGEVAASVWCFWQKRLSTGQLLASKNWNRQVENGGFWELMCELSYTTSLSRKLLQYVSFCIWELRKKHVRTARFEPLDVSCRVSVRCKHIKKCHAFNIWHDLSRLSINGANTTLWEHLNGKDISLVIVPSKWNKLVNSKGTGWWWYLLVSIWLWSCCRCVEVSRNGYWAVGSLQHVLVL